jgi:hypothetical protein
MNFDNDTTEKVKRGFWQRWRDVWGTRADRLDKERQQKIQNEIYDAGDAIITHATGSQAAQITYRNIMEERTQVDLLGADPVTLLQFDKVLAAQRAIINSLQKLEDDWQEEMERREIDEFGVVPE